MLSEAAAAVKAIKPTIEHGTIISKTENYKNTGVDRYIIAAKGNINGKESYVGVMVKAYPKARLNSKFYLHEATIIETDSHIMTAALKSNKTVSESASNPSIAKDKQNVNPSETNSSDKLGFSEETADEFAEKEKAAIEKALANMSVKDYNRRGWARTLLTREDVSKLNSAVAELFTNKKRKEFRLNDGSYAVEVNNKIVFVSGTFENPRYESVLVFNTDNATEMEIIKDHFFGSAAITGLTQKDIERFIKQRRGYGQVYGFNAEDYKASGRRDFGRAMLRSNTKGFGDISQFEVRDGVYTKDEGNVSLRVQGLKFSEETETSRDTLVSDMEAVAEAAKNEGKNPGMLLKTGLLPLK